MSTDIMMGLGDFRFATNTAAYQSLQRVANYRWTATPRLGRTPARQFLGPGEETVELEGVIYPHHAGGLGQLDAMRALAATGEPQLLVSGLGDVLGDWVILTVEERHPGPFFERGVPRKVEFRLSLGFYGEDEA